eukprot:UC1_evm1s532
MPVTTAATTTTEQQQEEEKQRQQPRHVVVLDATIVHPQGGGQPSDVATLKAVIADDKGGNGGGGDGGGGGNNIGALFYVEHAQVSRDFPGVVLHTGTFSASNKSDQKQDKEDIQFAPGQVVEIVVDEAGRRLHARLHSAGHLLDAAMQAAGWGPDRLVPSKGHHFPGAEAYVEYEGVVPADDRDALVGILNEKMRELVSAGGKVDVTTLPNDNGGGVLRTVEMAGSACPCGGTHVPQIQDIGLVEVTRMKKNKKRMKVYYRLP